jgi:O-antigen/teichoic acid export membrane protein
MVRRWFSDGAFRRVLRNASYLGIAKLLAAPLGLVAMASAGRGLSPTAFGLLMVIHAYAAGAGALAKFQTWQLIIRYGAPALIEGDEGTACRAIQFAFGLDIASGIVGMAVAMTVLYFVGSGLRLTGEAWTIAILYCTLIPTMTSATPTGVLRLFDRFDLIGIQQLITPILRAVGAVLSYSLHLGFAGFVVAWYVADLIGDLATWLLAAMELKRRSLLHALWPRPFVNSVGLPGAWSFAWTTNVGHSVYAAWGPLSNLIVASLLGPAAAGVYKIASSLLDSTSKPADLLERGFYPEAMRLDPSTKAPWRLGLRSGAVAGMIAIIMVLIVAIGGKPLIKLVFGQKYLNAYDLLQVMAWSLVVSMATFPLASLLYMVGRQKAALLAQVGATLLYLGCLTGLCRHLGLYGAGVAYLTGTAIMAIFMLIPTISSYRGRALIRSRTSNSH